MQTKFKRHQKVKLLADPNPEYIEYYTDDESPIKKGAIGKINILLPNGQYHVAIINKKTKNVIAYVEIPEEYLENIED